MVEKLNDVSTLENRDGIAVLSLNSPPVNALSAAVREGLNKGFQKAMADASVKAVVLHCEGRTFIAGADIKEFGGKMQGPSLGDIQDTMEAASKPIVAAIHGTALGGGFEVALTCHYRIAVPSARCGLPEVLLGLLPGAGGTQRLPRIVGVEQALTMVTSGTHVTASQAHEMGLVDALAPEDDLLSAALTFARSLVEEKRPLVKIRDRNDKVEAARGKPEIFEKFRKTIAHKTRGFLAPEYNVRCIEAAVNLPFDEGIALERKLFTELMTGTQSAAQRYVFFAQRAVWKVTDLPADTPTLPVKKVGVIGAGTMGGGISMVFANAGYQVTMVEQSQERLDKGLDVIAKNYARSASRGRFTQEQVKERLASITPSVSLQDLSECDLIIEAVYESMELKKSIFTTLDGLAKKDAILATNTSALDVNTIASSTKRPESVIGLHFFSPANVMRLLEVVRGAATAPDVINTSMQIARKVNKIAALVGVCPGFVGNRILAQRQREAQKLILEGALPQDVDRVLYDFGFPMGPFAMSDLAGLDIGWNKEASKGETLRDVLCEAGRLGQKSGSGYYLYDENRRPSPDSEVEKIILSFSQKHQITRRKISDEEILQRCIYPMINEGAKILEEKMAQRASDIDIIWINGYGWPAYRGGPMFYADTVGLDKVVAQLEAYEKDYGEEWKPARLLVDCARQGKKISQI